MQSPKKDSGKPDFFPTQSWPARLANGVLSVVGPTAIGVLEPGVAGPPDEKGAVFPVGLSVGKDFGS